MQLAVPSPEATLLECQRLQIHLDNEQKEHSRTRAELNTAHIKLTALDQARAENDLIQSASIATQNKIQRELDALREKAIDQAEQIQVRDVASWS